MSQSVEDPTLKDAEMTAMMRLPAGLPVPPIIAMAWILVTINVILVCIRQIFLNEVRRGKTDQKALQIITDIGLWLSIVLTLGCCVSLTWVLSRSEYWKTVSEPYPPLVPRLGLPVDEAIIMQKIQFIQMICYFTVLWESKCAFILFNYHFYRVLSWRLRLMLNSIAVFIGISYVVTLIVTFTYCGAVENIWKITGGCHPAHSISIISLNVWSNIVTNILSVILPICALKRLSLNKRDRKSMRIVFSLGGIAAAFALARFVMIRSASKKAKGFSTMLFYKQSAMWSGFEQCVNITLACIPNVRAWAMQKDFSSFRKRFEKGKFGTLFWRSKNDPKQHHLGDEVSKSDIELEGARTMSLDRNSEGGLTDVIPSNINRQPMMCLDSIRPPLKSQSSRPTTSHSDRTHISTNLKPSKNPYQMADTI
ncbi:hypothetical protein EDC01DRAFT_632228 [Geopyxis carbonaria]|nr:hypothetical protein EDC01DRAFT_632228 [Geopyxis carbonaria]